MRNYTVKIEGLTPLLMHFDNIEAQDEENAKGKAGGKAGDDRYPADKWKTYLYLDENRVVWPAANILSSLLKVGSSISIGGKKTLKSSSQALYFADFYLRFVTRKGEVMKSDIMAIKGPFKEHEASARELGFSLLTSPARVNGKRHVRVRPMFEQWRVEGSFSTDDADLTSPRLSQLFTLAGMKSGLGDWRPSSPSKPGPYGRFKAEVVEV